MVEEWEVGKREQTLGYIEGESEGGRVGVGGESYRMWTGSEHTSAILFKRLRLTNAS